MRKALLSCALWASLAGCTGPAGDGDVTVTAFLQELTAASTARVTLTITGPSTTTPIVDDLTNVNGSWQGTFHAIPAGTGYTFQGEAYDSNGAAIYNGSLSPVSITAGQTTAVALLLQQAMAPMVFQNNVPRIDGIVVSNQSPAIGEAVGIQVSAHDSDAGDTLSYSWQASAGGFTTTSSTSATWAAPSTTGPQTLTVRVTDQKGGTNAVSFTVNVTAGRGSAGVTTTFNTWPVVSSLTASPGRIDVGQTTALTLLASDPDGDSLSYSWTSSCAGTFSNPSAQNPQFTLAQLPSSGSCALVVSVTDGRGGRNAGTISIQTGPGTSPTFAPGVDGAYQSSTSVIGGGSVTFSVTAHDPQGGPLTFNWTANVGTLGAATLIASNTSQVVWTAPNCFPTGIMPLITVAIVDQAGISTTQAFSLSATNNGDPNFSKVVLLMHFDGANGSTSFTDVKGHAVAAQGSAELSTATAEFGASGYFNPAGNAYLTSASSSDWDLTSGDSTIEMWINPTALGWGLISQSPTSGDAEWVMLVTPSGALDVQQNGGASNLQTSDGSISVGSWQHVAVVRSSGMTLLFVNGVLSASGTQQFYTATTNPLYLAAVNTASNGSQYLWNGYLDELRITKGVARYTANFTPPTTPFADCAP